MLIRIAKIKNSDNIKFRQECRKTGLMIEMQNDIVTLEDILSALLKKINKHLPYDLAITLLGIYPRGLETEVPVKTCAMTVPSSFICNS